MKKTRTLLDDIQLEEARGGEKRASGDTDFTMAVRFPGNLELRPQPQIPGSQEQPQSSWNP